MKKLFLECSFLFLFITGCLTIKNEYTLNQIEWSGSRVVMKFTDGNTKITGSVYQYYDNIEILVGNVKNGWIQGTWTEWYSSGIKKFQCHYSDNKKTGKWVTWYDNGRKKLEENYIDGKKNGLFMEYFESGNVRKRTYYKDDLRDGLSEFLFEDGSLITSKKYLKGELVEKSYE